SCEPSHVQTTPATGLYTLSLHDALPILQVDDLVGAIHEPQSGYADPSGASAGYLSAARRENVHYRAGTTALSLITTGSGVQGLQDRKSTRLNSSHSQISYAVFCLKKKKR